MHRDKTIAVRQPMRNHPLIGAHSQGRNRGCYAGVPIGDARAGAGIHRMADQRLTVGCQPGRGAGWGATRSAARLPSVILGIHGDRHTQRTRMTDGSGIECEAGRDVVEDAIQIGFDVDDHGARGVNPVHPRVPVGLIVGGELAEHRVRGAQMRPQNRGLWVVDGRQHIGVITRRRSEEGSFGRIPIDSDRVGLGARSAAGIRRAHSERAVHRLGGVHTRTEGGCDKRGTTARRPGD